jgi:hypothetical protein
MAARDRLPEVRNPVLALPASARLLALPADKCWKKHKAPMACYWKAVSVYANHLARVLSR